MDSRVVVQSEVNENDERYPHIVASEQVTHGAEDHEKKSVLNKVKKKAKKIKDTIKKHGHQVLDRGLDDNSNEDQHTLDDDDDLDEDEEMDEAPQVHETPIHESEDVKTATPTTSEQVKNLGKSGIDFGGTTITGEEPREDALLGGVSSTTEIDQNIAKTFSVEEKAEPPKDNLERSIGLEAYTSPDYQIKLTDPSATVTGKDEIEEEITPIKESFAKMNVQPTVDDSEYPLAENHDQFVPHLSAAAAATQTQYPSAESRHDQFNQETLTSTNINRTIATTVEEQSVYEANTGQVVSPKDVIGSEVGSGEKDEVVTNEEQHKSGKNIAHSLSEKLGPVYEKVAGVGSAVKSKVTGTSTETKNEVSVTDYLAEKLRPGEEDKALSEVISEALHKRKEEPMKNIEQHLDEKMCEESCVKSPGKGVVGKLKNAVGSWFGKSEEKGGEDLSNSAAEVEQVHQVIGENKE